jgi:hypothetical protein
MATKKSVHNPVLRVGRRMDGFVTNKVTIAMIAGNSFLANPEKSCIKRDFGDS